MEDAMIDEKWRLRSYPKIYGFGHAALREIKGPFRIEEKVDGSQFSFGVAPDGTVAMRSRNNAVYESAEGKLFASAAVWVRELHRQGKLDSNLIYRGEVLHARHHNALTYGRVPKHNVILFDAELANEEGRFITRQELEAEAERMDLEVVPVVIDGVDYPTLQILDGWLKTESVLGSVLIEGIVMKPQHPDHTQFGRDGKALIGKYVSESFKETHAKNWGESQPKAGKDIVQHVAETVCTPVRWEKVLYHMREDGLLTNEPKDIGPGIKKIQEDVIAECTEMMKDLLLQNFQKDILRTCIRGFPEWYKRRLVEASFDREVSGESES